MSKETGFSVIRAERAGVFIGKIVKQEGSTIVVTNCRRLYRWYGALDVISIAVNGVGSPNNCKFSAQFGDNDKSTILNVVEHHPITKTALATINSVPVWKK